MIPQNNFKNILQLVCGVYLSEFIQDTKLTSQEATQLQQSLSITFTEENISFIKHFPEIYSQFSQIHDKINIIEKSN